MKRNRLISAFVVLTLLLVVLLSQEAVFAAEQDATITYDYDGYAVTYCIDGVWDTGYNVRLQIANTSDRTIEDWEMVFSSSDSIINIWNAEVVYNEAGTYVIANAEWNKKIASGETVEWGYTAQYDDTPDFALDFDVRETITDEVSSEHMEQIIDVINQQEMADGDSVVVDNAYLITCSEEVEDEIPKARTTYMVSKTMKKTYEIEVLNTRQKVFAISHKVQATINTYTNKVKIVSHDAYFTSYNSSYKYVSEEGSYTLGIWLDNSAYSTIYMTIKVDTKKYLMKVKVTVTKAGKITSTIVQL